MNSCFYFCLQLGLFLETFYMTLHEVVISTGKSFIFLLNHALFVIDG